jgi:hypothetical protein
MRDQLKHFAIFAVLLAVACAPNRNAFAQDTTLTEKARQSIVYILFDVTNPTTGAKSTVQGTGFIVSKSGFVLTASHLFREWGKQTEADRNQNLITGSLRDTPGNVLESPLILRIVNPGNVEYEDVALLRLPDAVQSFGVASVCIREATAAGVGNNFVGYGFPQNQSFQPVEGILGTTNAPGGRWAAAAPFTYGMSGGPVYTTRGFVIGLIKGGLPGLPAVNWITPIQYAIVMLQQAGYEEDCAPSPAQKVVDKEPSEDGGAGVWPKERTVPALRRRIERVSRIDREVLQLIVDAEPDGLYPDQLAQLVSRPLSRQDVITRTERLVSYDLVEILDLTDKNYRISEKIKQLFGSDYKASLKVVLGPSSTNAAPASNTSASPEPLTAQRLSDWASGQWPKTGDYEIDQAIDGVNRLKGIVTPSDAQIISALRPIFGKPIFAHLAEERDPGGALFTFCKAQQLLTVYQGKISSPIIQQNLRTAIQNLINLQDRLEVLYGPAFRRDIQCDRYSSTVDEYLKNLPPRIRDRLEGEEFGVANDRLRNLGSLLTQVGLR